MIECVAQKAYTWRQTN